MASFSSASAEALFADHLLGHHQPHDVVVAHAEPVGEFLSPVGDAVAGAKDFEGPDVYRGVGDQRAVHVEYSCFLHRRFRFQGLKIGKIPDTHGLRRSEFELQA